MARRGGPRPRLPVAVGVLPFLLVGFGDLRNLITPAGYWVAWVAAIIVALVATSTSFAVALDRRLRVSALFVACILLLMLLGASFAAAAAGSVETFYHWLKLAIVFGFGFLILVIFQHFDARLLYRLALITTFCVLTTFLAAKFLARNYYIELGDGRQGLSIAFPGVMWKTGAFFYPIFLLYLMFQRRTLVALLGLVGCMALVLLDGSRTGLMWISAATVFSGAVWASLPKQRKILAAGASLVSGGLLAVVLVLFYAPPLAVSRLLDGDEVRKKMLADSVARITASFPFGGGFGTTVSDSQQGEMIVHNAYLQATGDLGAFGALALIVLLVWLVYVYGQKLSVLRRDEFFIFFSSLVGVSCFLMLMLLHPLSTEMSEWGWFFLMLGLVHTRKSATAAAPRSHSVAEATG